jgi:hypothetical protein
LPGLPGFDRKLLSIIASMPALRFAVDAEAGLPLNRSNTVAVATAAAVPPNMILRVSSVMTFSLGEFAWA